VIDSIPEKKRSQSLVVDALSNTVSERVLGIKWNIAQDNFAYEVTLPWKPRT